MVAELNSLIERGMPEFVHVVLQKELGEADLHDEKHIKVKSVGKYVSNMKNKTERCSTYQSRVEIEIHEEEASHLNVKMVTMVLHRT